MKNLKYILMKNKMMIVIIAIILICGIAIALGVYAQITNRKVINGTKQEQEIADYQDLKEGFDDIFTNTINKEASAKQDINYDEIIYCAYDIKESNDNYNIDIRIPEFKLKNDVTKQINNDIYNTFTKTVINIVKEEKVNTKFNLNYVVYVNGNIMSLVLNCKYKYGSNPQRQIIQTYNYDIENNKLLTINDILQYKNINKEDAQQRITEIIKEENKSVKAMNEQGYNVYVRDEEDKIYKIENTPNFFIGKNNHLYLVYSYGNNKYTDIVDLVIF